MSVTRCTCTRAALPTRAEPARSRRRDARPTALTHAPESRASARSIEAKGRPRRPHARPHAQPSPDAAPRSARAVRAARGARFQKAAEVAGPTRLHQTNHRAEAVSYRASDVLGSIHVDRRPRRLLGRPVRRRRHADQRMGLLSLPRRGRRRGSRPSRAHLRAITGGSPKRTIRWLPLSQPSYGPGARLVRATATTRRVIPRRMCWPNFHSSSI